jgi:hypothetical protein
MLQDTEVWTRTSQGAVQLLRSEPEGLTDGLRAEGFEATLSALDTIRMRS